MLEIRNDWNLEEINALFNMPFNDLLFMAHSIHREIFDPNQVQVSSLLNIKTGACPEDCSYCSQSSKYDTNLDREKLMEVEQVLFQAKEAKDNGASRFCMGAAFCICKQVYVTRSMDNKYYVTIEVSRFPYGGY